MSLASIQKDIEYIESLREKSIGFEMQAFYNAILENMREAHFRSLMLQDYGFEFDRF